MFVNKYTCSNIQGVKCYDGTLNQFTWWSVVPGVSGTSGSVCMAGSSLVTWVTMHAMEMLSESD